MIIKRLFSFTFPKRYVLNMFQRDGIIRMFIQTCTKLPLSVTTSKTSLLAKVLTFLTCYKKINGN